MPINPFKKSSSAPKNTPCADRARPLGDETAGMVEYACLSHAHLEVPHYYRRRKGAGSTCDCGREN